jgi:hypothetical protein
MKPIGPEAAQMRAFVNELPQLTGKQKKTAARADSGLVYPLRNIDSAHAMHHNSRHRVVPVVGQ